MGELIGLAAFAQAKRRRLEAECQQESLREERAEALVDEMHRYRMSAQRQQRRRLAVPLPTDLRDRRDGPRE